MLYWIHMHDFKSHFQQDFLAYCTRPISVHLVMASVGCLFNSFSIFLLSLKQQQNLMKIMFWLYPFSNMAISPPPPPPNNEKLYFILVNCMGWQVWGHLFKATNYIIWKIKTESYFYYLDLEINWHWQWHWSEMWLTQLQSHIAESLTLWQQILY